MRFVFREPQNLSFPFQTAFFDDVIKAEQKGSDKEEHFQETYSSKCFKIDRPRVHKDDFDIKHDEEDGGEKIFYGKRDAGISYAFNSAFKGDQLSFSDPPWTYQVSHDHGGSDKTGSDQELYQDGNVIY